MSISVVNGYVCENSCDVAKAKKGEDPHPKTGSDVDSASSKGGIAGSSRVDGPAVVLGGRLANMSGSLDGGNPPPATPETRGAPMASGSVIDILA